MKYCPTTASTLTVHKVKYRFAMICITVIDKIELLHLRHVYVKFQIDQITKRHGVLFSRDAFHFIRLK